MTDLGATLKISQEAIRDYFLPQVVVYASESAKKICHKNQLTPAEFLSPFFVLSKETIDRGFQMPRGNSENTLNESINIERIKTIDFEEWAVYEEKTFAERLNFYIKRGTPNEDIIDGLDMSNLNDVIQTYNRSAMKEMFKAYLNSLGGEHEFTFFNNCQGLVVLTSKKDNQIKIIEELIKNHHLRLTQMLGRDVKQLSDLKNVPLSNIIIFDHATCLTPKDAKKQEAEKQNSATKDPHNPYNDQGRLHNEISKQESEMDQTTKNLTETFQNKNGNKWFSILDETFNSSGLESVTETRTFTTQSIAHQQTTGNINFDAHLQDKIHTTTFHLEDGHVPANDTSYERGTSLSQNSRQSIIDALNTVQNYFFEKFTSTMQSLWLKSVEKKKLIKKGFFGMSLFKKEETPQFDRQGSL